DLLPSGRRDARDPADPALSPPEYDRQSRGSRGHVRHARVRRGHGRIPRSQDRARPRRGLPLLRDRPDGSRLAGSHRGAREHQSAAERLPAALLLRLHRLHRIGAALSHRHRRRRSRGLRHGLALRHGPRLARLVDPRDGEPHAGGEGSDPVAKPGAPAGNLATAVGAHYHFPVAPLLSVEPPSSESPPLAMAISRERRITPKNPATAHASPLRPLRAREMMPAISAMMTA